MGENDLTGSDQLPSKSVEEESQVPWTSYS